MPRRWPLSFLLSWLVLRQFLNLTHRPFASLVFKEDGFVIDLLTKFFIVIQGVLHSRTASFLYMVFCIRPISISLLQRRPPLYCAILTGLLHCEFEDIVDFTLVIIVAPDAAIMQLFHITLPFWFSDIMIFMLNQAPIFTYRLQTCMGDRPSHMDASDLTTNLLYQRWGICLKAVCCK